MESRCILVVDDDASIRAFVEMALSDEGYEVLEAADGGAALALLETVQPAVILLDMRMPMMDGWTFAQNYGARPAPRAPIVVITAARDAANWAAQIGADAYLSKPFEVEALYDCVARYATRTGQRDG
jgi:CheY-like chemotaxis protein